MDVEVRDVKVAADEKKEGTARLIINHIPIRLGPTRIISIENAFVFVLLVEEKEKE